MLLELLDLHRPDLDPAVIGPAEDLIAAFAPSAPSEVGDIGQQRRRWFRMLGENPARTRHARAFCHAVAGIPADLTTNRRSIAPCLADALAADDHSALLDRFVEAARQAVVETGARRRPYVCARTVRLIEIFAEQSDTLPAVRYIKARAIRRLSHDPAWTYCAMDAHGRELRTVDVSDDGRYQYADVDASTGDAFLKSFPSFEIEDIYDPDEFEAMPLGADEFERLWKTALRTAAGPVKPPGADDRPI